VLPWDKKKTALGKVKDELLITINFLGWIE